MLDVTLAVTLKLQGPILTHSTAPGASHVSSPFARNAAHHCSIPGSLIKGRLREAWTELESAVGPVLYPQCGLTIDQLLGAGSGNPQNEGQSTAPQRGRLHFDDFIDGSERPWYSGKSDLRYRIKLDETRGSVSKGAYQVIEAPYASGEEASFVGTIQFRASDSERAQKITQCIQIGLHWIANVGANCNVGFGRLLDVQVDRNEEAQPESDTQPVAASGAEVLGLQISFKSPFCIARRRLADNLFESETIVPGAVIKGSVAHTWRTLCGDDPDGEINSGYDPTRPELCENFHLIRFTHAFPANVGQQERPVTAPLSLVKGHGDQFVDVALHAAPVLLLKQSGTNHTRWIAPRFAVDWKENEKTHIQELFGWANPNRELRVRTAIDATRRKAMEEQLFAYEMIAPEGVVWHSSVDLGAIRDPTTRTKVEQQLRDLLAHSLRGIGKTKAQAEIAVMPAGGSPPKYYSDPAPQVDSHTLDHFWLVTLQTPVILCDPQHINTGGLAEAYRQAWGQFSSFNIQLKHFFSQESLAGGYYLYRRFMKPDEYYPYLLTDQGSVFVLAAAQGKESEAQACINDWLEHGLPLPSWAVKRYERDNLPGDDWRNCPYLREGGYGEIAVNLQLPAMLQPRPEEVEQL